MKFMGMCGLVVGTCLSFVAILKIGTDQFIFYIIGAWIAYLTAVIALKVE